MLGVERCRCLGFGAATGEERAKVFLGGVFSTSTPERIAAYLKASTRFTSGEVHVEIVSCGSGRGVFVGPGAHRKALQAISVRNHRPSYLLAQVKEVVDDWFCPCCRSGPQVLFKNVQCPACGRRRPESLEKAAETVELALTENACAATHSGTRSSSVEEPLSGASLVACPRPLQQQHLWQGRSPDTVWQLTLRAPLTWKDLPSGGIFKKLDACLSFCTQNGEAWRSWAYDLQPAGTSSSGRASGVPKHFVASTLEKFVTAYSCLPESDRHTYEIIPVDRSCRPYFDLEYARKGNLNASVNGDVVTHLIVNETKKLLTSCWQRQEAPCHGRVLEFDVVMLDSHSDSKWSRHLLICPYELAQTSSQEGVLPTRRHVLLRNLLHAGRLARALVARLGQALNVEVDRSGTGNNEVKSTSIIDRGVYTKNRLFRLVGSSKIKRDAAQPILEPNFQLTSMTERPGDQLDPWVRRTLVVPEDPIRLSPETCFLELPDGAMPKKLASISEQNVHMQKGPLSLDVTCSSHLNTAQPVSPVVAHPALSRPMTKEQWMNSLDGLTHMPLLDLPTGVAGAASHPFIQASTKGHGVPPPPFEDLAEWATEQIRSWPSSETRARKIGSWNYVRAVFPSEQLLHLHPSGTRFCFHKQREHQQQNVMLTVDLLRGCAWQRCWDAECCVSVTVARRASAVDSEDSAARKTLKVKHALERPPDDKIPGWLQLNEFEQMQGLVQGAKDHAAGRRAEQDWNAKQRSAEVAAACRHPTDRVSGAERFENQLRRVRARFYKQQ